MPGLPILIALLLGLLAIAHGAVPVENYRWKSVRVGAGGFVTGMTVHPLDPGVRYARTDVGNGYRWDTASQTWQPVIIRVVETNSGLSAEFASVPASLGVESIAVDPSDVRIVYMAFGLGRSNDVADTHPASSGALYKSADGGITFTKTGLEIQMRANGGSRAAGERIAVDPVNGDILYYGSVENGLHQSINSGISWSAISAGGPAANANVLNVNFDRNSGTVAVNGQIRTRVIYAGVLHGDIFRSEDGGRSWTNITAGTSLSGDVGFSTIDQNGKLYVIRRPTGSYLDANGVTQYYHYDSNEFWTYSFGQGVWQTGFVRHALGYTFGGYGAINHLAIDPNNALRLFGITSGGALNRSTDGGQTWTQIQTEYRYANTLGWLPQREVGPYRSNGGIILDQTGRLWSPQGNEGVLTYMLLGDDSENEANPILWTIQSEGIEELVGHDVIIPPGSGDKAIISVHDAGALFIDDPDLFTARQAYELQDQLISNGLGLAYCPNAPEYVALSASDINRTSSGRNYSGYSTNGGRSWRPFASQPVDLQCGTIAVSRRGNWSTGDDHIVILPSTNKPPSYSHDGGRSWNLSTGIPVEPDGSPSATGMWNFSLRQRLLIADPFVVDRFYFLPLGGDLYTSNDGGRTWSAGGGAGLPNGRYHSQLFANIKQPGDLWFADGWEGSLGQAHGLHRSTDGGANFSRLGNVDHAITLALGAGRGQSGDEPFTVYVYGKVSGDAAWGVFRSTDAGGTWTRIAYNPAGNIDRPSMMAASWDTFGLVYITLNGSTAIYGKPGDAPPASGTGGITHELWFNQAGSDRNSVPFDNKAPDMTAVLPTMEAPPGDFHDRFGQRLRGFITPPASGNYTFWLAADDDGELRLSTTEFPADARVVATVPAYTGSREWSKFTTQKSAPIPLIAGKRYYIEARSYDAGWFEDLSVAWRSDGAAPTDADIIGANAISPWRDASQLEAWRLLHFGTISSSGIAALDADPDQDGFNNLLEYALGGNPVTPIASPLYTCAPDAQGVLELSFTRERAELTYEVRASSDLVNWTVLSANPGVVGQLVTVKDVPANGATKRFLGLKISSP